MSADTPILHHYAPSPFSEKVRKVLGYKQLAWHSVVIPPVMPRPDLMPLTGGYRKTPVMQLGGDIYCDSKLICKVIDQLKPTPPLVPPGLEAATVITERWVDQALFFGAVALFFQPAGLAAFGSAAPPGLVDTFLKDRAAMFAQGGSLQRPKLETARAELPGIFSALEAQLGSKPFLCGEAPTQIDFAVYNPVWFIYGNSGISSELTPYPKLRAWTERLLALGEGKRTEMPGPEAVELCRASTKARAPLPGAALALPGVQLGDTVKIGASDYAVDMVEGELVIANTYELAIRREDPRAGTVIVHFPPEQFAISKV